MFYRKIRLCFTSYKIPLSHFIVRKTKIFDNILLVVGIFSEYILHGFSFWMKKAFSLNAVCTNRRIVKKLQFFPVQYIVHISYFFFEI